MRQGDRFYHRYAKEETAIDGFLDDYAFFILGLIELYESTFEEKYLNTALTITKSMIAKFWDDKNGGFFQTQTSEAGLPKLKQLYDGAVPSGNSVALFNLLRLSRLTNEITFDKMATQMIKTFAQEVEGAPEAYTFFLSAYDFLKRHYMPATTVAIVRPDKSALDYQQIEGKTTAYVCRDQMCLPPTNNLAIMLQQLETNTK